MQRRVQLLQQPVWTHPTCSHLMQKIYKEMSNAMHQFLLGDVLGTSALGPLYL